MFNILDDIICVNSNKCLHRLTAGKIYKYLDNGDCGDIVVINDCGVKEAFVRNRFVKKDTDRNSKGIGEIELIQGSKK